MHSYGSNVTCPRSSKSLQIKYFRLWSMAIHLYSLRPDEESVVTIVPETQVSQVMGQQ